MNVEALAIIGGGALVLLVLIVPVVIWLLRNSRKVKPRGPHISRVGLAVYSLQTLLMLAAAIVANFFSGWVGAGIFMLSLAVPWGLGALLQKRGYRLFVAQPDSSLEQE